MKFMFTLFKPRRLLVVGALGGLCFVIGTFPGYLIFFSLSVSGNVTSLAMQNAPSGASGLTVRMRRLI